MPRSPRTDGPDTWHHVMNRGIARFCTHGACTCVVSAWQRALLRKTPRAAMVETRLGRGLCHKRQRIR